MVAVKSSDVLLRKLISTTSALLCNTLSDAGVVRVQPCSIAEFHAHVVSEANLIKEAMLETTEEAERIMSLLLSFKFLTVLVF